MSKINVKEISNLATVETFKKLFLFSSNSNMSEKDLCDDLSDLSVGRSELWSEVVAKIWKGLLPKLEFADERPATEADFRNYFGRSLESLKTASKVLESVEPELVRNSSDVLKHFIVPTILLCSENNQKFDWTKVEHIELSYRILNLLKNRIFQVSSIRELLLSWSDSDKMLRWSLEELRPKLVEKKWKSFPGAQQSFVWILNQVFERFFILVLLYIGITKRKQLRSQKIK